MKTISKKRNSKKKVDLLYLMEQVVEGTDDAETLEVCMCDSFYSSLEEVASHLKITKKQALLLSVFVNLSDDNHIQLKDLARHFGVKTISVLSAMDDIDELVRLGVIIRFRCGDGDTAYRVPVTTISSLRKGALPEPEKMEGLNPEEWICRVSKVLTSRAKEELDTEELEARLQLLFDKNEHLQMVMKLKGLNLEMYDLVLYLVMTLAFVENHDDHVMRCDFEDYFTFWMTRHHASSLESGCHTLQQKKLVEYSCIEGQVESNAWCLTEYSKSDIFAELNLKTSKATVRSNMTRPEDIAVKSLYYNDRVTASVSQLKGLLDNERMQQVMRRLSEKGLRKGFTCLFYGGPGTGKTETALQLAKATGRDIMRVDVPSIRSKWVGETEKNIKALFDRYHRAVKDNELAPILLFNEADALLNRRNAASTGSVDKMENAMQNIILEEMEKLEGIMIATTNLTGMLDPAFERRFLYKIEFDKPSPKERCHIWQSMLPELTDADALKLAERYDFSGGQIENIARKRIIDDILACRDELDLDAIVASCEVESLQKKTVRNPIGFN